MLHVFMPYADVDKTIGCLAREHVMGSLKHGSQILGALEAPESFYGKLPDTAIWVGAVDWLTAYINKLLSHAYAKGWVDRQKGMKFLPQTVPLSKAKPPFWWGRTEERNQHSEDRRRLLKSLPGFYSQYGWEEDPEIKAVWPERKAK